MKTILILVCCYSMAYGQFPSVQMPFENGKVSYRSVIDMGTDADSSYKAVYEWVASHMVDNNLVITLRDNDLRRIIFNGDRTVFTYSVDVYCHDTKAEIKVSNIVYKNWLKNINIPPENMAVEQILSTGYLGAWEKYLGVNKKYTEQVKWAIDQAFIEADSYFRKLPYDITGTTQ